MPPMPPMPPVGPLTSIDHLLPGDLVRFRTGNKDKVFAVNLVAWPSRHDIATRISEADRGQHDAGIEFVARPGIWIKWSGGKNPVPGRMVSYLTRGGSSGRNLSDDLPWGWTSHPSANIVAYCADCTEARVDQAKHISPEDVVPGDQIEVTIPMTVVESETGTRDGVRYVSPEDLKTLTGMVPGVKIHLIDRPAKPIAVGDRVNILLGGTGTVLHIEGDHAMVKLDGRDMPTVLDLDSIKHA